MNTRVIRYLNIEPRPTAGNPTYLSAATAILSSKPKVTTNKMILRGKAGSYKDDVETKITPGAPSFSATTYSAALMIVSEWQFFDDSSTFASTSLASADPIFAYE